MDNEAAADFTIERLGEARYESPLELSETPGDFKADYTPDDARIIINPDSAAIAAAQLGSSQPPSLEVAGARRRLFFPPEKTRAAIVTCGGLCPGINDAIRALVIELWWRYGLREILGIRYGYRGLHPAQLDEALELNPDVVRSIHREGGSFLYSSRGPQPVEQMADALASKNIDLLFVIGGDGTQRGALELVQELKRRKQPRAVIGIPKTIDNDISCTERTFGFETAFSIARDILHCGHTEARCAMNGVGLVKLMGRHSGFIAARAALAAGEADFVLIPEVPFDLDGPRGFLQALANRLNQQRHALVVVAEGAGQDLLATETSPQRDKSGNFKLADIGPFLKKRIQRHFALQELELNLKYIDPSYIIRSAPASAVDAVFCQELAHSAVHAAMSGRTGMIVGEWNQRQVHIPLAMATAQRKLINPDGAVWRNVVEATGQPAVMKN